MAFNEYKGQCIGRLMRFLYEVNTNSDYWQFGHYNIISNGSTIGHFGWRSGTDIPVFVFNESSLDWMNKAMMDKVDEIVDSEKKQGRSHDLKILFPEPQEIEWKLFKTEHVERYNYNAFWRVRPGKLMSKGLYVTLGSVTKRSDGRYNWRVTPEQMRYDWKVKETRQGVANTLEEAKAKVEEGWNQ